MEILSVKDLTIKLFADGADLDSILKLNEMPYVKGFTTNPTLMRKAEIINYENFARAVLEQITDKPVSFEVFSDEFEDMHRQAMKIAGWGSNVYVKIPITNTRAESSIPLIKRLLAEGVPLNVTAIMTRPQLDDLATVYNKDAKVFVSVFAGRIADAGRDPVPFIQHACDQARPFPDVEVLWASCREVFNIVQAQESGCHIITVTNSLLEKINAFGKDLADYSLDTVKMFYRDAQLSGFVL